MFLFSQKSYTPTLPKMARKPTTEKEEKGRETEKKGRETEKKGRERERKEERNDGEVCCSLVTFRAALEVLAERPALSSVPGDRRLLGTVL